MNVRTYIRMYVCTNVCIYECMNVCMYVCILLFTNWKCCHTQIYVQFQHSLFVVRLIYIYIYRCVYIQVCIHIYITYAVKNNCDKIYTYVDISIIYIWLHSYVSIYTKYITMYIQAYNYVLKKQLHIHSIQSNKQFRLCLCS